MVYIGLCLHSEELSETVIVTVSSCLCEQYIVLQEIRRIFTALNKIRGDKNLADDRKRLAGVELQRLYVATGNAKISGAVEQVQATLDEGAGTVLHLI